MGYQWDWSSVWTNRDYFLRGVEITAVLTVLTMIISIFGGLGVAGLRMSRIPPLRWLAAAYVEAFRTTPFLMQLFWIFYGIPYLLSVSVAPFAAGLATLSLNLSAYNSEIFRSGIVSIAEGQRQAGLAVGMTPRQVFRRIILPQALRRVIPPLGSQWVSMFQATSLVSFIAVPDLMYQSIILRSDTYRSLEVLTAAAVIYIVLGYPQAKIVDWIYRRSTAHE